MKTGLWKIDGRGRPSEDRAFVREVSGETLIAGVFDGHSGSFTVEFTIRKLPDRLVELVKSVGDNEVALRSGLIAAFLDHDKLLAKQGALSYRDSGSTATVVILTAKLCVFAYIGDSPACIFNPDTGTIYGSIGKHDPSSTAEKDRIVKNGGEVTTDEGDAPRVNGCLMVSRAFGDFSLKFKEVTRPTEFEMASNWAKDFCVVAEPDIIIVPRPEKGTIAVFSDGFVETPETTVYREYPEIVKQIRDAAKPGVSLDDVAKTCIQQQVATFNDVPSEYDGDDITLVLINFSAINTPAAPMAQTRKHRQGHRRTRSSKKKLTKSFYI